MAESIPCTCTYGWSETARRVALLSFDSECQHCLRYSNFGVLIIEPEGENYQ